MKIKQIGDYKGDIISTILENRKIEDIELFLNPNSNDDLDPFKLANMQRGIEILIAHLQIGNKIGILVDPDADGFTSSSILYQYIKKIAPQSDLVYFLHDNKAHGLTEKIMAQLAESEIDLLLVPDAASNDLENIMKIEYMQIDLIIIDHHEVELRGHQGSAFCTLINNQVEENIETNKNLVGAGMTFKFCQALDTVLGINYSEDFYDLVTIGQVGDASDISQNEVRNMAFKGIKRINNPFVKLMLEEQFTTIDNIVPKDLSFSIIPLINAVVRVGTVEEKELLFRALNSINAEETWTVEKKKKNRDTGKFDKVTYIWNLYEYALDVCKKVKARQASMVKKIVADLEKEIDNSCGIAIGILETSEEGSVTGLVANKTVSKFQKPVLLLHHVNGKYVGSGRGHEKTLLSLKDWCNETGLVEFATGHANAFGISIFEENFEAFKEKMKDVKKREFVYEVDLWLHGDVDREAIRKVNECKHLFGGKVHEPLFAFTGIKVRKSNIKKRGSILTFFHMGVEFIMYNAPESLFEDLTYNFEPFITMDFVGTPSVNTWGGKDTPQIVIVDCERNEELYEVEVTVDNISF